MDSGGKLISAAPVVDHVDVAPQLAFSIYCFPSSTSKTKLFPVSLTSPMFSLILRFFGVIFTDTS